MTTWSKICLLLLMGMIGVGGLELGHQLSIPGFHGLIVSAVGEVGRPLTPVSVAGVGRRTSRRCATGVYDC
jgi:hypothetical protein